MRPIYEAVDLAVNTSLKVATYSHTQKCETMAWHIHPEYELVYIKNGRGTLRIDTQEIPYDDGALLFLGPNIPHADFGNKEFADNLEIVIQFDDKFVDEKLALFPEFSGIKKLIDQGQRVALFKKKIKRALAPVFERLGNLDDSQKLITTLSLLDALSKTAYDILKRNADASLYKSSDVARLETIFEYVNEHYNKLISTSLLARHVGLTPNSFSRFFKKTTDKTFVQFLNEYRTRKAIEFFNNGSHSVSEVMYNCGYSDASYFAKQFKKNHGLTPKSYLESRR